MKIAARLLCHHVDKWATHEVVTLQPVYSDKKDSPNYTWSQATPSGKLEMTITNPNAMGAFVPGQEYDILFTPVPKEADKAA